jgi:hypothetical protein
MRNKRDAALRAIGDEEVEDGRSVRVPMMLMDGRRPGLDLADAQRAVMRQPMTPWRSGYALLTDEQVAARQAARQGMIDRATSAWRMDAKRRKPDNDDEDGDNNDRKRAADAGDQRKAAIAARNGYVKRLTDAWKRPPTRDFAEPDAHSYQWEWQRHMRNMSAGDPYSVTDPDRAKAVESQLEITCGKRDLTPRSPNHGNVSAGPGSDVTEADVEKRRQRQHAEFSRQLENAWKNPPGISPRENAIVGAGPRSRVVGPTRGYTDPPAALRIERQGERWRGGR